MDDKKEQVNYIIIDDENLDIPDEIDGKKVVKVKSLPGMVSLFPMIPTLDPTSFLSNKQQKRIKQGIHYRHAPIKSGVEKIGRNQKCPCGSGLKFKKCPCDANK